ncbi:MAG: histidine kinase [Bacteroidia bacterium]|nr:histidine kinase [Bacteroidia bacterium]
MNKPELMLSKNRWIIFILWWTFLAVVHSAVLVWLGFSYRISFIDSIVSATLIVLCGHVTSNFYRFYQPGKTNRFYRLLWGLALTVACVAAQRYTLLYLMKYEASYSTFVEQSLPVRFLFSLLIIAFMTLITWLSAYWREQQEKEARKVSAENFVKEAELARLRLQLQPHFLFNSLNSVNALIGANPAEARKMIQELSDFMRMTLRKDDQLILFSEELNHLQLYLNIEKVRFGHRLEIIIEVEEECKRFLLPPLLLQPIVENAIKFGLYNTTENVEIKVTGKNKNGMLEIITENPFDDNSSSAQKGTGFGLSSVQRRLQLLFGRNDLLKTSERERIFQTTILIPQKTKN